MSCTFANSIMFPTVPRKIPFCKLEGDPRVWPANQGLIRKPQRLCRLARAIRPPPLLIPK